MRKIFDKLVQAEKEFCNSEFVAPIFFNRVAVRISGIITKFDVIPCDFQGWAILKPDNYKSASVVRDAPRALKNRYLQTLPRFSFVISDVEQYLGINVDCDQRITSTSPMRILLADNLGLFDTIIARFDGVNFWYDRHDMSRNRTKSSLLDSLDYMYNTDGLKLKKGYKEAYKYALYRKQQELFGQKEYRIKNAIERAGGEYVSYDDVGDDINVTYKVDDSTYTSTLTRNLDVISAGICLSGEDMKFDLQSLISVVREGQDRNAIYRY